MSKEEFEILLKSILDSNKGLTQEGIAIELLETIQKHEL